ncbi:hypothetical protein BJ741DRAFT_586568 [Chytriomyces cf. hyalinus JEL632]|nr:hypothetical protein BJ741DRAFT_586568 [Chytriomyces cf. hyalinus JEL632]
MDFVNMVNKFLKTEPGAVFQSIQSHPYPYLTQKTRTYLPSRDTHQQTQQPHTSELETETEDPACAEPTIIKNTNKDWPPATIELHIAYSTTFQTPLLLFNARDQRGEYLTYDWVVARDVVVTQQVCALHDALPMNTHQNKDHPQLLAPFHALHLCNTHAMVREMILACQTDDNDYLLTWWTLVRSAFLCNNAPLFRLQ